MTGLRSKPRPILLYPEKRKPFLTARGSLKGESPRGFLRPQNPKLKQSNLTEPVKP